MTADDVRISLRVTPRAGQDRIDAVEAGRLRIRVSAAPAGGAANSAVLRLLADALDVPVSRLRLVSGATGRLKVVAVAGISPARVAARWPDLAH
jgi:uncharacterized protein